MPSLIRGTLLIIVGLCFLTETAFPVMQPSTQTTDGFIEGCCVNTAAFPGPKHVSQSSIPESRLLAALHCATRNRFYNGPGPVAQSLGDDNTLRVAYYYGRYMPGEDTKSLTMAVYAADGKRGLLFDMNWDGQKFYISNFTELVKAREAWRVGEIMGGIWSYTRLWYLAQEIGSRPRQEVPVKAIIRSRPGSCTVMGVETQ